MNSSTDLVVRRDHFDYEMLMVVAGFLAGYTANTLMAYQQDLRVFVSWCQTPELPLLEVRRAHIELFARSQETAGMARATIARRLSTVASFYRYCVEEELIGPVPGGERETTKGTSRIDHDRFGSHRTGVVFWSKLDCPIPEITRWRVFSLSTDYGCPRPWVLILVTSVWSEAITHSGSSAKEANQC